MTRSGDWRNRRQLTSSHTCRSGVRRAQHERMPSLSTYGTREVDVVRLERLRERAPALLSVVLRDPRHLNQLVEHWRLGETLLLAYAFGRTLKGLGAPFLTVQQPSEALNPSPRAARFRSTLAAVLRTDPRRSDTNGISFRSPGALPRPARRRHR